MEIIEKLAAECCWRNRFSALPKCSSSL